MKKKKKKKYNLLEIIAGIFIILFFLGTIIGFILASIEIISYGVPIISFGTLFILMPLFGKDIDNCIHNKISDNIIFITVGFAILFIGIAILYNSLKLFIYSFVNSFGIIGLAILISSVYSYIYNKKRYKKKVSAICTDIIEDQSTGGVNYYCTRKIVFTAEKDDSSKDKELVYNTSSHRVFVIGQTYEIMVNPKSNNDFYICGDNLLKSYLLELIIASIFIIFTIVANYVLLTSTWPLD